MPSSYTTPTTRITNEYITPAIWNTDLVENIKHLAESRVQKIAESEVTSGTLATIDWQNIPQNFRHLMVVYSLIGNQAGLVGLDMRFNNNSTATCEFTIAESTGATWSSSYSSGTTVMSVGIVGASGGFPGRGKILIPGYRDNQGKSNKSDCSFYRPSVGQSMRLIAGLQPAVNAAIDRIQLFPGVGVFAAPSVATLYGLPA